MNDVCTVKLQNSCRDLRTTSVWCCIHCMWSLKVICIHMDAPGVGAQIMSGSASSTSSHSTQALARMDLRGVKMSACHGMETHQDLPPASSPGANHQVRS